MRTTGLFGLYIFWLLESLTFAHWGKEKEQKNWLVIHLVIFFCNYEKNIGILYNEKCYKQLKLLG